MAKYTRYVKASNSEITVFRCSPTMTYNSAKIGTAHFWRGLQTFDISFSGKPASVGTLPCVEISKAEYDAFVKIKAARGIKHNMDVGSPSDSWVFNADLPALYLDGEG